MKWLLKSKSLASGLWAVIVLVLISVSFMINGKNVMAQESRAGKEEFSIMCEIGNAYGQPGSTIVLSVVSNVSQEYYNCT